MIEYKCIVVTKNPAILEHEIKAEIEKHSWYRFRPRIYRLPHRITITKKKPVRFAFAYAYTFWQKIYCSSSENIPNSYKFIEVYHKSTKYSTVVVKGEGCNFSAHLCAVILDSLRELWKKAYIIIKKDSYKYLELKDSMAVDDSGIKYLIAEELFFEAYEKHLKEIKVPELLAERPDLIEIGIERLKTKLIFPPVRRRIRKKRIKVHEETYKKIEKLAEKYGSFENAVYQIFRAVASDEYRLNVPARYLI